MTSTPIPAPRTPAATPPPAGRKPLQGNTSTALIPAPRNSKGGQ